MRSKLHAHLALIITTTGFQSGAKDLAQDEGIKLIEAPESDPSSDKWKIIIPTGIVTWASLERNASAAQAVLPVGAPKSIRPEPTSPITPPTLLPPTNPLVPEVKLPIAPSQSAAAGALSRNAVSRSSNAAPTQRAAIGSAGASVATKQEPESNESKRGRGPKLDAIRNTFDAMRLCCERFLTFERGAMDGLNQKLGQLEGLAKELTKHVGDVSVWLNDEDDRVIEATLESIAAFDWYGSIDDHLYAYNRYTRLRDVGDLRKVKVAILEIIVAMLESKPGTSTTLIMDALLSFICGKASGKTSLNVRYRRPRMNYHARSRRRLGFWDSHYLFRAANRDTTRILGHSLKNTDAHIVNAAVELLCMVRGPEIIEFLAPQLHAASAKQVIWIANAFHFLWFSDRDAEQTEWRHQAGEALGRCINSSRGLDIPARMACVEATASGKYPSAKPWLLDAATDPDEKLRKEAIYCLAELGDESALAELLKTAKGNGKIGYRTLNVFASQNYLKALSTIEAKASSAKDQTTLNYYIEPLKKLNSKKVKTLEALLALLPKTLVATTQVTPAPVFNPLSKLGIVGLFISATLGKIVKKRRPTRRDFLTPWRLFWKSKSD